MLMAVFIMYKPAHPKRVVSMLMLVDFYRTWVRFGFLS